MNPAAKQMLDKFKENHPDKEVIFLVQAGSHFFDLATENSDQDFRGIYMPSNKEFYEGETKRKMVEYKTQPGNKKNVKNTKNDVDFTLFSITKFFQLLKSGDFNMMELLHAPENKIIIDSPYITDLRSFRKSLLVNDISAFLGFIKKEYKRYGININHYKAQENLLKFLEKYDNHTRIKDIWKDVEEYAKNDNMISFTESRTGNNVYVKSFKIAQRLYQNTVTVEYIRQAIKQRLETYGHRQRNQASAGIEFKGLYHSLRLIYEANDLYDYGEFKIPFNKKRQELLLKIKTSNIDQETLFNFIDKEIDLLYKREKKMSNNSNRHQVGNLIDRLYFKLEGQKKVEYLLNG